MPDGSHGTGRLTFSQRHGYEPLPKPMEFGELSDDLRFQLWNHIRSLIEGLPQLYDDFYDDEKRFFERTLGRYLRRPEDEIPSEVATVRNMFKKVLLGGEFNQVFDLLEITINDSSYPLLPLAKAISETFDRHAAPYWLEVSRTPYEFFQRGNEAQGQAIRDAFENLQTNEMEGATTHFRNAGRHINDGEFADSIRESIHGVESVARLIDPKASNTLGPALVSLQQAGKLQHPALKAAFNSLYGYTNDESGIRHALLESGLPNVGLEEAMFMFGACASFANYLLQKHQRTS